MRSKLFSALAGALLLALAGCSGQQKPIPDATLAKVACDESFERIIEQEINVYEYIYPKENVLAIYVPEKEALDSLMSLTTFKTAVLTRALTEKEITYLKQHKRVVNQKKIAVDALALIVNPANPVNVLSKKEIAEILTGEVTRWDQVEPCKLGDIEVVFDHQGSSTVAYMRDSVLNGRPFAQNVYAQKTSKAVFETVTKNKNAIGIIGVSWLTTDMATQQPTVEELAKESEKSDTTTLDFAPGIKVLKVRGNGEVTAYKPYQAYIFDGSYPLYRSIYMVTTVPSGMVGHRFFSFVTSFQGQKLIQLTGVLPAVVRPNMVEISSH